MNDQAINADERHRQTLRVTAIGLCVDLLLTAAKLAAGLLTHSYALIADAIHSVSDALTDLLVMAVSTLSKEGPDADHPYGHGRYETVATVALGLTLGAVAVGMAYQALISLFSPSPVDATPIAFIAAALSVGLKEWQYRFTIKVGRRLQSDLVTANAWHSRADALSSIIVIVGLIGVTLGFAWLDGVAALIIAAIVMRVAAHMVWDSVKELVDTNPSSSEESAQIIESIKALDGVLDAHCLRSRKMGPSQTLDMHLQVAPRLSVSEGHYISDTVVQLMRTEYPAITDLVVHIDAEDDDHRDAMQRNLALPNRSSILRWIETQHQSHPWLEYANRFTLHYLDGQVHLESVLSQSVLETDLQTFQSIWQGRYGGQVQFFYRASCQTSVGLPIEPKASSIPTDQSLQ